MAVIDELSVLVTAANAGDHDAADDVLDLIRPLVLPYCRRHLARQQPLAARTEDVVQAVCRAVLARLPRYRAHGQLFLAFVYNVAAGALRDSRRAAAPSPAAQPLAGQMWRLLGFLTPTHQDILLLRLIGGLSAEETAAVIGSRPGDVRIAQHRALSQLRSMLPPCASET